MAEPSPRERILQRIVAHVLAHGLGDASLRELAAAVGTSHRMLGYHFGSRDGLLTAVVEEVERRQLEALQELAPGDPATVMLAMHRRLASPDLAPLERLFFELYGRALQGDAAARPLLDPGVRTWIDAVVPIMRAFGVDARRARAEATLALATSRGLLLDLLATGDRRRIDAAARLYIRAFVDRLAG